MQDILSFYLSVNIFWITNNNLIVMWNNNRRDRRRELRR